MRPINLQFFMRASHGLYNSAIYVVTLHVFRHTCGFYETFTTWRTYVFLREATVVTLHVFRNSRIICK